MSTAAELLDPKVLASIKAEFHEIFVQKREEVRRSRAEVQASKSAPSGHDRQQAASEGGTLAGTKRSREGRKRPMRPLKRPRVIQDVPNTSSDATREQCYRDLWENHTFAELSSTGALQAVRKVRVREEMYEPLRAWKEVERGITNYDEHECYRICQINCFRSRDIRRTLPDRNEVLTSKRVADAIKDRSIVPTFPPLNVPAILKVASPDGQSAILALNRDETGDVQASHEPLDLWPHLKPGINIITINLAASPSVKRIPLQQKGQSHGDHPEEDDGYIFVLQTTEPKEDHLKLAFLHPFQKGLFERFRIVMQETLATRMKTIGGAA